MESRLTNQEYFCNFSLKCIVDIQMEMLNDMCLSEAHARERSRLEIKIWQSSHIDDIKSMGLDEAPRGVKRSKWDCNQCSGLAHNVLSRLLMHLPGLRSLKNQ